MLVLAAGLIVATQQSLMALPADDFSDNSRDAIWSEVEDNSSLLAIDETNQRLQATSSKVSTLDLDALYLSDGPAGFALGTGQDFRIRISYDIGAALALASTSGSDWSFALDLGFGTTASGDDSFAAAVAWAPLPGFGTPLRGLGYAYRVNGVQTAVPLGLAAASGTLYLSYTASSDTIVLSDVGYSDPSPDLVLPGVVQGQWSADQVLVAFGARGHGVDIAPGAAWLDDFVIDAGEIIPVPEPASGLIAMLAASGVLWRRRR